MKTEVETLENVRKLILMDVRTRHGISCHSLVELADKIIDIANSDLDRSDKIVSIVKSLLETYALKLDVDTLP